MTQPMPQNPNQISNLGDLCREHDVAIVAVFDGKYDGQVFDGDKPWPHFLWNVTLLYKSRSFKTEFKCGIGCVKDPKLVQKIGWGEYPKVPWSKLAKPPTVADVLSCLCSDARSADRVTFEDWCSDLGYDTDSRRAKKIYQTCVETNAKLHAFLGEDFDLFANAEH